MSVATVLALVVVPSPGPPPAPGDAQLYIRTEDRLLRVEDEAGADCGVHTPWALHRVINLRWDLTRLREYVERDPDWARLASEARERRRGERLCITNSQVPTWLREARRDISTLQLHARRAGYYRARRRD